MARLISVNVGLPKRHRVARQDRLHRDLQGPRQRAAARVTRAQRRRRRPGRPGRPRRRAARRVRLPDRLVPLLGAASWAAATSSTDSSARTSPSRDCRDDEVCIGDRYRIGTALFEVTQPRTTCYRVGIRMNDPHMPALLDLAPDGRASTSACSQEGEVGAGRRDTSDRPRPGAHDGRRGQRAAATCRHHPARGGSSGRCESRRCRRGWRWSFEELVRSQDAHPEAAGKAGTRAHGGGGRADGDARISAAAAYRGSSVNART